MGDSGGPLIRIMPNGEKRLIGNTSWGDGDCDPAYPGTALAKPYLLEKQNRITFFLWEIIIFEQLLKMFYETLKNRDDHSINRMTFA